MHLGNKDKGQAYKEATKNLAKDIEYYDKMVSFLAAVERLNRDAKDDVDVNDISKMMEDSQVQYALYVDGKPNVKDVSKAKLEKLVDFLKKRGIEGPYEIKQLSQPVRRPDMIGEASGYIPSEAQKNDPRFSYALTVDVHPDTMKKGAKAMGWNIQRDGRPPLLRPGKGKKNKNSKTDFGKGIY